MSMKITKADLIEAIYSEINDSDFTKKDIQNVIDLLVKNLKKSLTEKSKIELRGFGTFELRLRKGKVAAHNPKTGEKVSVKPHYVAVFRAGQELKNNLFNLPVDEPAKD